MSQSGKYGLGVTPPITVPDGGTGLVTITDHGVMVGSGVAAVTPLAVGTNGQVLLGSTAADPIFATLTSAGGTVVFTPGAGSLNLEIGGAVAVQFDGDGGSAVPALGVLTVAGGTNITTAAAGSTMTVNLDAAVSGITSLDFATGGRLGTALLAGNTTLIQAYDVDGAVFVTFATLTANNVPTMDLDEAVTKSGGYIYRAGGTDVPVADGGTGASTLTDHGIVLGSGATAVTVLAAATHGQLPIGSTGADPVLAGITGGNNIGVTNAAGSITVDVNGTTDHAMQVGNATASLTSLAAATDGQLIIGSTGVDPAVADLTSTNGTLTITAGAGTLDTSVGGAFLTPSGFESWGGAGNYYDDTTLGQFDVLRPGTGYIKGVPVAWTATQTVTGMTAGNTYYIYIDDTGTIGKTTVYSDSLFRDNIVLFECMRDSTAGTNVQVTVKENHPFEMPWLTSVWAHDTIGCVIASNSGGANIVLNGTQKIEISGADELEDHGLETDIPDSGGVAVLFEQYFTLGSGKWARHTQSDTFDGTYDNAGTATALGANKYSVSRLYVSKDDITTATPRYFSVLGDAQYNNLTAANTAIANDTIPTATSELASLEMAQLGYIVFEESSTSIVEVVIAKETARTSFSGVTATTASLVLTDTSNFDGILSVADTTVQASLETIDDWGKDATDHGVLIGQGVNTPVVAKVGTNGQVLLGSTGADPAFAALTSTGGTISFTAGAGTLNLEAAGILWSVITADLDPMLVDHAYIVNKAGLLTTTLPTTAAVGSILRVTGINTDLGWKIAQSANQIIHFGDASTTTGAGGSLASTLKRDSVELVCVVADLEFNVISSIGNITLT